MDNFYVGQKVMHEKSFTMDEVILYTQLSGDENPVHTDVLYAKNSRFGDNIVHGMFVMGVVSKILGTMLPGKGTIYLGQDVQFRRPVYVGKRVFFEVEIVEILEQKKQIILKTNVFDEEMQCLVEGTARVLYEG